MRVIPILPQPSSGLGDEPCASPTPSAPPHSAPLTHSASWECLSTLPTNGSPLRHVTHVRPRPPRRHRAGHLPPESVSWWPITLRWPLTSACREQLPVHPNEKKLLPLHEICIQACFSLGSFSGSCCGKRKEKVFCIVQVAPLFMFNCPVFDLTMQRQVQSVCFHKRAQEGVEVRPKTQHV